MIHFHVVTLFPEVVDTYIGESIIGRAVHKKQLKISLYNPRDFTKDKHHTADDRSYGGGPGMVLKAEPILRAVERARGRKKQAKVIFFSPSGRSLDAGYAKRLAKQYRDIILIAGHYEGVDARVQKVLRAEKISIGPYVLTGGELPAMVVIDAVARYVPGVLGKHTSLEEERVASAVVYTRPESFVYKGKKYRVPKVLRSGHHNEINSWRRKQHW